MKYDEQVGKFKVFFSEEFYGKKEIELTYTLCGSESDDFAEQLAFVRDHYQTMYYTVLKNLLLAYRNNPKWDIWNEETHTFSRLDLQEERDVHKYIGEPTVEIMRHEKKVLIGLSFYKNNKMSIEHGFCAIFDYIGVNDWLHFTSKGMSRIRWSISQGRLLTLTLVCMIYLSA